MYRQKRRRTSPASLAELPDDLLDRIADFDDSSVTSPSVREIMFLCGLRLRKLCLSSTYPNLSRGEVEYKLFESLSSVFMLRLKGWLPNRLPVRLEYLRVDASYENEVDFSNAFFPTSLEILRLSHASNLTFDAPLPRLRDLYLFGCDLEVLPLFTNLKTLFVGGRCGTLSKFELPDALEALHLEKTSKLLTTLKRLPSQLRALQVYQTLRNGPQTLEVSESDSSFVFLPKLPDSLKLLRLEGLKNERVLELPRDLTFFELNDCDCVLQAFPRSIKYMWLESLPNQRTLPELPSALVTCMLYDLVCESRPKLPRDLKGVHWEGNAFGDFLEEEIPDGAVEREIEAVFEIGRRAWKALHPPPRGWDF